MGRIIYLFLNSLLQNNYNNTKVLLLSPVLGPVFIKGGGRIPKRYSYFKKNILNLSNTSVKQIDIVYGGKDDHFSLKGLELIQRTELNINYRKLVNQGHSIDHSLLKEIISGFFEVKKTL